MSKPIPVGSGGRPQATEAPRWAAHEARATACDLQIVTCSHLPIASDSHAGRVPLEARRGAVRAGMLGSAVDNLLDEAAVPVVVLRDDAIR